jgi:hypothetical protein
MAHTKAVWDNSRMGQTRLKYWIQIFKHDRLVVGWIAGGWTVLSVLLVGIGQKWGPLGKLQTVTLGEVAAFFDLKIVVIGLLAIALFAFMESSYRFHHPRPKPVEQMPQARFELMQSTLLDVQSVKWPGQYIFKFIYEHRSWDVAALDRQFTEINGFKDPGVLLTELERKFLIHIDDEKRVCTHPNLTLVIEDVIAKIKLF